MISILHQMTEYHYQEYINAFPTRTDLLDFLMEIFMVFRDLISKNLYPNDWATMIVQQNRYVLLLQWCVMYMFEWSCSPDPSSAVVSSTVWV